MCSARGDTIKKIKVLIIMDDLASTHLSAAVPFSIERLRDRGGPNESDITWAQSCMQTIRDGAGGHAIAFHDGKRTTEEMNLLTEILAIMAFVPGGVRFSGLSFNANAPIFGIRLDEAFFADLEPFRLAMDRVERESRRLEDVSAADLARLEALNLELMKAADRGDTVQQALLEAQIDAITLAEPVATVAPLSEPVQIGLGEIA